MPPRRLRWALLAGLLLLAAQAQARPVRVGRFVELPFGIDPAHPHPTAGGGARRAGRLSAQAPQRAPRPRWETQLRASLVTTPAVVADGSVILSATAGLSSVGPDGQLRWSAQVGSVGATASLAPDGSILTVTHGGELIRLSADGAVLSEIAVGGAAVGSPLVLDDGSVVVAALGQTVHRFDADGRRLFRTALPREVEGAAALGADGILIVPAGGSLFMITTGGAIRREVPIGRAIVAGPAVSDDGTVWALNSEHLLVAVGPGGRPRSRTNLGAEISALTGLVVGRDGAVRVGTVDSQLVCIGPGGTERWRTTLRGAVVGGVAIDREDTVLVVETGQTNNLVAIGASGRVRFRVDVGSRVRAAPVLGPDGTIYVATASGSLAAFAQ